MGNSLDSLGGGGNSGGSSGAMYGYGPEEQCCDAVVDIVSLLAAIGAIGAVSLFLRQAVIDNMIKGRKLFKRDAPMIKNTLVDGIDNMIKGMFSNQLYIPM